MSVGAYPEYRESGVEWLGDIPSHWRALRLRSIAVTAIVNGVGEASDRDDPNHPRYIRITDIAGPHSLRDDTFRSLPPEIADRARLEKGDVLFAAVGATFGKTYIHLNDDRPACFAGYLVRFRSNADSHPRFISFWSESSSYWAQLNANVIQSTVQNFSASRYRELWLSVPSLNEQVVIVEFLDRETGKIDALVAEQERLIALLKEKRQAVISQAVTKGLDPNAPMKNSGVEWLGEVPERWEVRTISSLTTKITNGYVGPTRDILVEQGVRYLQSLHIKNNKITFHIPYFVTPSWSNLHSKSILQAGDVVVVQTGDVGQAAIVPEEFAGCNCHALIILAPLRSVLIGPWLSWVLNSEFGRQSLLSIQTGALHPHLNCGDVKDVRIPLPPINDQAKIIEHLEEQLIAFEQLVAEAECAVALLNERRAALISAAVTGKIDVRDLAPSQVAEAA